MSEHTAAIGHDGHHLSFEEVNLLANVDTCLAKGIDIMRWWEWAEANGGITDSFELSKVFNRPDSGHSFFAEVPLPGGNLPVMGDIPLVYYDQPKDKEVERWTREVRAFALDYFLRITDSRLPQVVVHEDDPDPPAVLRPFSGCPRGYVSREGFGFRQLYYKRRDNGEIGRFPEHRQLAIVNADELRRDYEWVVGKVRIFDFDLSLPLNPNLPRFSLPLSEAQYVILSDDFVHDTTVSGGESRFSVGYAMLHPLHDHSVLAYGPGQFEAGFQRFDFLVDAEGAVNVRMPFVVNRPTKIIDISLDPLDWGFRAASWFSGGATDALLEPLHVAFDRLPLRPGGFDPVLSGIRLANLFTLGQASRQLCISKESLEKFFLVFHFNQYYTMITGSLLTWRQIRDWLDTANLPTWVKTGISS